MYVPTAFAEVSLSKLHDFVERHSFGLLVSQVEGVPFASHLPFLLDRTAEPFGSLIGHMARANPQWRDAAGQTVLVVFSGPHAYISPTWYEADNVVPTWNYTAVHVYGKVELVEDEAMLLDVVRQTVGVYEQGMPQPWSFDDSATFVRRLLGQIIGFRIKIDKIEGKWKLNQNHPAERRAKVVEALSRQSDDDSQAIAAMMRAMLAPKE